MAALTVPDGGWTLYGAPDEIIPSSTSKPVPPRQAMRLHLDEGVFQNILRTARSGGKGVHVSFGDNITLHYGNRSKQLTASPQHTPVELYSYNPDMPDKLTFAALQSHRLAMKKMQEETVGADAALAKLQASLASQKTEKQSRQIQLADGANLPPALSRGEAARISSNPGAKKILHPSRIKDSGARSLTASPQIGAARSPQIAAAPTSIPTAEDSQSRKIKAMRIPLIHFLAVRPVSEKYLAQTIGCSVAECRQVLEKVGKEYRLDKSKWDLNDKFFKELDPYFFNYPSQDDRKLAIDRAISAFDRQRISSGDPMWQKLLPVHERGKGKSLSKLELKKEAPRIQKATTPRINVQATENTATGGLTPSNDSDAKLDRLAPSDAEAKAPSGPRGPAVKPKPGDRQPKKGPPQKSTRASKVQKPKDTKKDSRKGAAKAQAKSSEFVHDSDEDEDEEMTDASAQQGKPDTLKNTPVDAKNPLAAPASKPRSKDAPTKAKSNGITAVQRQSPSALHNSRQKAPTSNSSNSDGKHRSSDSSHSSAPTSQPLSRQRTTSSPHKPSPLGSSPPANASDIDIDSRILSSSSSSTPLIAQPRNVPTSSSLHKTFAVPNGARSVENTSERSLKRKADDIDSDIHNHDIPKTNGALLTYGLTNGVKRPKASPMSPPTSDSGSGGALNEHRKKVVADIQRYQKFAKRYNQLYEEVTGLPKDVHNPKFDDLMKMHNRLSEMKAEIEEAAHRRESS